MKTGIALWCGAATISLLFLASSHACAQSTPSSFTTGHRYDLLGRETGVISPSSSGAGGPFIAVRNTYNQAGAIVLREEGYLSSWQSEAIDPANWSSLTISRSTKTIYDEMQRISIVAQNGPDGSAQALVHYNYDVAGRPLCTAVRMNPAVYPTLPSACSLSTQANAGPDRVTKNIYDDAGQLIQVRKAVGTPLEEAYTTYGYSPNGKQTDVIDANGNHAQMVYDGFDRQTGWYFPSASKAAAYTAGADATSITQTNCAGQSVTASTASSFGSAGGVNCGDYEAYAYDANGNRTVFRKRDGSVLSYTYDALNRVTSKIVPGRGDLPGADTRSVFYSYDLQNHQIAARFDNASGEGVGNAFDGLGRQTSSSLAIDGVTRTVSFQYDADGNRMRMTYPDGNYVTYSYDGLDRPILILRSGAASTPIASYTYNPDGTRSGFNGGVSTSYGYDSIGRLNSLTNNPNNNGIYANTYGFGYNPASQIASLSKSNNTFVFNGSYNVNRGYSVNGLNQYTQAGAANFVYDANGNLTGDGSTTFLYDVENRLVGAGGGRQAQLRYDPLGRLYESSSPTGTTRFFYNGDELIGEYDTSGNLLRRYAHGADLKSDDPIAWYEGAGFDNPFERFLRPDWQGSIALVTDNSGSTVYAANTFDEYGIPGSGNAGRFQYTGQAWMPELGMYYYKARFYSPTLGRFMQTDPIGYKDQVNLYAYVGNDPLDKTDYTGTQETPAQMWDDVKDFVSSIAHGDFEYALGGLPPTLGGGVVSEGLAAARVATTARAEISTARAAVTEEKTYQTYTKTNSSTGQTYTGRTSGTGTPAQNIARRESGHHMNGQGYGPARLDKSSSNPQAIRGREQQMIERNGGAQSQGGTSGNRINGISDSNPKGPACRAAATKEFGPC